MLLSDLGADVLRVARQSDEMMGQNPIIERGRHTLFLDLRKPEDREVVMEAIDLVDVLVEGFRPGVMERLGLGPDVLMARNGRLIYGRVTGWGQSGPLSKAAAHDINFIALSGALAAIGKPGEPSSPPLNLVGDYGGGSMLLTVGVMAALFERSRSGKGQVVDAAMVDGVASLMSLFSGLYPRQLIDMDRSRNLLGGAAPFYRCYCCADGKEIAVGPIESKFYADLLRRIDAPVSLLERSTRSDEWPKQAKQLKEIFLQKSRDEWCAILEGTDACFAPVLTLSEAPKHHHLSSRGTYITRDGYDHPAPAPRFSRTNGEIQTGGSGEALLTRWKGTSGG
jgi:alpha-methylacyl-CoA racemase